MTPMRTSKRPIKRVYVFTVVGDGLFPFDMLRYDICYPKREADSSVIEKTTRRGERGPHRVTLASSKAPTEERWGSFGWAVESVE